MTERTCPGGCCAVFGLRSDLDEVRREASQTVDGATLADMLVPLTREEGRARHERFIGGVWRHEHLPDIHLFTCRHWDSDTRLCTIYERRPQMCRDFPYEGECPNCDYRAPADVGDDWRAYRVRRDHG